MSKKETVNQVVVNPDSDFTTAALMKYLNEKYPNGKKTGKAFTLGDVQQYVRRGFLPKPYGFHPLTRIEDVKIGIKLIRVDFNKTIK